MKTFSICFWPTALLLLVSCFSQKQDVFPSTVLSEQEGRAKTVYLTRDLTGFPVLAWTEADSNDSTSSFYFSKWDSVGRIFGKRVKVPASSAIVTHAEGMPKVVFATTGSVYAVYAARIDGRSNPYAGRIEYLVSHNGGGSWSGPHVIHRDSTQEAGHDFFDAIALKDGRVAVSWLDKSYEKGGRPVHFATTDSAGGFAYETVVDDYACECCRTALYECDGMVVLLYRNIEQTASGTVRDIHYSVSDDGGVSFRQGVVYSSDGWRIDGCPHNGPDVVMDKESLFSTWFTAGKNKGLFYGELDRGSGRLERALLDADGHFAQLALLTDGRRIVVYNARRHRNGTTQQPVFARVFPKGKTVSVSSPNEVTDSPVVVSLPDGGAIAAWISREGTTAQVRYTLVDFKLSQE